MSKTEVKFIDFTVKVQNAIDERAESALEEVSGDLEAQVKRNTRVKTGNTKESFQHKVSKTDEGFEANIGSDKENAIWEEFGTGEYALKGNGRKGGWGYEDEKGEGHFTHGKRPSRAFWNAYTTMKNKIITDIQNKFKGL